MRIKFVKSIELLFNVLETKEGRKEEGTRKERREGGREIGRERRVLMLIS